MSTPTITAQTPYVDISLSRVDAQQKSNLNAFFGKGRESKSTGKVIPRDWYEVEIIVDTESAIRLAEMSNNIQGWLVWLSSHNN